MSTTTPGGSNEVERRRWNDLYWTSVWPRREELTDAVTSKLLEHLEIGSGERVLDVGSGGGKACFAAAEIIGPKGSVLGADISEPLAEFARARASERGIDNVRFAVADVQHDHLPGAPFDVAMSQFGVMFFDEPLKAFANIARHVLDGGRLGFACWRPMAANPWHIGHVTSAFLPPPAPPARGKQLAGPFSLGDPRKTTELLRDAGWTAVQCTPYEQLVNVARDAIVDEGQLAFMGVPEARLPAAQAAVEELLGQFATSDGRFDIPLAFQIVTASKPLPQ